MSAFIALVVCYGFLSFGELTPTGAVPLAPTHRSTHLSESSPSAGPTFLEKRPVEPKVTQYVNQFRYFGQMVKDVVGSFLKPPKTENHQGKEGSPRDIGFQITCSTCTFAINLLISFVQNGRTEEEIARTAINICITFKIESEMVCKGAVNSLVKPLVFIIKHSSLNEQDICGFVLRGDCEQETYESVFNWTVPFPKPEKPPVVDIIPPKEGMPTLKVLHLSDTHLDPFYEEGSLAACGAPLCCRSSLGMPSNVTLQAGKWGDYRNCDSPRRTIEDMLEHISSTHKLDMVIWTGDLPPHDIYNQSRISNLNVIKEVNNLFGKYFPDVPIFPAIGNHESFPINCYPHPEISGEFSISWLYNELSKSWKTLLKLDDEDISFTMEKGAFYSVAAKKGLRIISLNMNYCNNLNWYLLINTEDPAQELKWLIDELTKAEQNKEKVYILGHIPPGNSDCAKVWSRNYHKVVHRFENTIAAQFFGHTHFDEMMVFYEEDTQRPFNLAYIGASTTPFANLNPAYKIYTVDGDYPETTRMVLDGDGYYMNLTEANLFDSPKWRLLYSYKDDYEMPSLLPKEWDKFFRKLSSNDEMYLKYLKNLHRKSDHFPKCNQACRTELICRQIAAQSGDYSMCKIFGLIPENGTLTPTGIFV